MRGIGATLLLQFFSFQAASQISTNWHHAGYRGQKPVFTNTINIMNHGGNVSGAANDLAFASAVAALGGQPGVIYMPQGKYTFTSQISINRDSLLVMGDGHDKTRLSFSMNGAIENCINVHGHLMNSSVLLNTSASRASTLVSVNAGNLTAGDWVYLQCNDSSFITSNWAYGSVGQILQLQQASASTVTFNSPLRHNYFLQQKPHLTRMIPRTAVGFECMAIERTDATSFQTSLLSFDKAVQCWVHGVEGDSTNYAHVELNRCSNVSITNCWFHHAHAYGGGGQGYGIVFQYSTGECLAENNILQHLRHSVLFQAGANGNVVAYNYSFDPYWQEGTLPANSAGDIVFHGNYPFLNLVEGNICQNAVSDNSHGINGPFNTFFRNRIELYGLIMNSGAGDSLQLEGNEITNTGQFMGNFILTGAGNVINGNIVKGVITPQATSVSSLSSLYLAASERPLCFNTNEHRWPHFGNMTSYNQGENAAKDRWQRGITAECNCSYKTTVGQKKSELGQSRVFPNPVIDFLTADFSQNEGGQEFVIFSPDGQTLISGNDKIIDVRDLAPGVYILQAGHTKTRFIKVSR